MSNTQGDRNQAFDLLRIVFATMVLFAHAFELTDGNRSRELFHRFTHTDMSLGEVGVDGFFLLSGFLIVQSWQFNPELLNFLRKRGLRILPGYLVAALLSTVVVGLCAPGVAHFFRHLGLKFPGSLLLLSIPVTPRVFPGLHFSVADGALWTIAYEVRCYLLVALLGVFGLLRRPTVWFVLTVCLLATRVFPDFFERFAWDYHKMFFGDLAADCRLTFTFLVGGCFFLFRDRIRFVPWKAVLAGICLFAVGRFASNYFQLALVLCGGYLLFYLAQALRPYRLLPRRFPDISYGTYLYGWPVLGLGIWYLRWSPWRLLLVSVPVTLGMGWLSWHFVERPMLRLKRRATAALPPP